MAGALLLNQGNPAAVVAVPTTSPVPDLAIGSNFERFDGLGQPPLENPAAAQGSSLGASYGHTPRPGELNQPQGQVYTPGALVGVVGVIGGEPLPVSDRLHRPPGNYTGAIAPSIQFRQGVGQRGPSELGAAQTVALAGITNNPPEPGDLSQIISGQG